MADIKWIKLTTDMFDNRKIKHLRKLPEGNNIVLIWVMLLTMAGRCNSGGLIFLTENIPYTPKMLADELGFEENTVQLALKALEQFNMIVTEEGFFTIAGWEEYQNIEGMDKIREQNRIRKQKQRERTKQKLIGAADICVYCGEIGNTVDHVIARAKGGLDIPENTVCCCSKCNDQKNDHDVVKFLNDRLLMGLNVDIQRITESSVLQKYVRFDYSKQKFVTGHVTGRHATEEDKEEDSDKEKDKENISIVVSYLNEKAGTNFKATTKNTQSKIKARFAEGFTLDDFKTVIDKKCKDWLKDSKMAKYLRPETLFGTHFESYLNERSGNEQPARKPKYENAGTFV